MSQRLCVVATRRVCRRFNMLQVANVLTFVAMSEAVFGLMHTTTERDGSSIAGSISDKPQMRVLDPGDTLPLLPPCCCTYRSYPNGMQFTSGSSKASCLYVGSVATAQYSYLTSTMHMVIKQQQELKLKPKDKGKIEGQQQRSCFQRTPAFIVSVVTAALSTVQASTKTDTSAENWVSRGMLQQDSGSGISFTPPRGGFTDVGRHSDAPPKATSWPVLQSVFQVGLPQHIWQICTLGKHTGLHTGASGMFCL